MNKKNKIKSKLVGITPDKLPQAKLVEYLAALTSMYGESENVHFLEITKGSVEINSCTSDTKTYESVLANIKNHINNNTEAHKKLTKYLVRDNFTAEILSPSGEVVFSIKPREKQNPISIAKKSKVQGRLYKIGGRNEKTIPVKLEGANDEVLNCEANPQIAAQLGKYLFKKVRVHGLAVWENINGKWKLKKLKIEKFEVLKDIPLNDALNNLAKEKSNKWDEIKDRNDILRKFRSIN